MEPAGKRHVRTGAHSNRSAGTGIVDQFFDDRSRTGLQVLMGGGRKWFLPANVPGSARSDRSDYAFSATDPHTAEIVRRLMGTNCSLKWRVADERERLWVVERSHPIAAGLGEYFELPHEEMYGERFDIPKPDATVFISWFEGGEVFRSGCCWERGHGRVFYFRPGHESYPTYFDANVRQVLANAVQWAAPTVNLADFAPLRAPLEQLGDKRQGFAQAGVVQDDKDLG